MEAAGLVLRVVVSLGLVLCLLWFAARGLRKTQRRTRGGVDVDVLARQPLARNASLAVVRLGDRALVLGVTESRIDLLHDAALADVMVPWADQVGQVGQMGPMGKVDSADSVASVRSLGSSGPMAGTALAGSALNPQTWARAVQVLRERTVRR